LIEGVLVIHSPASTEHEEIFGYMNAILSFFLDATKRGRIFGSRVDSVLVVVMDSIQVLDSMIEGTS